MSAPTFVTLAAAISALNITHSADRLTILDFGETPDAIDSRTCPVMFVDPEATLTDFEAYRTGCGPAGGDVHGYRYSLNYYVAVSPVGAGRRASEAVQDCAAWAQVITGAIADEDDSLGVQEINANVDAIGQITDPLGNVFHGLRLALRVEEY